MHNPNVHALVAVCSAVALEDFGEQVVDSEVEEFLRDLLFGGRALWAAIDAGLITFPELALGLVERFLVWLSRRTNRPLDEIFELSRQEFVFKMEAALRQEP